MGFSLYFDPGTGALIVQFVAAGVAGAVLFYKTILGKVKNIFGIKEKNTDDFPDDDDLKEER